jgi:Flp pilus assembly protein TadG
VAAVEFAIVLPVLIMLMFLVIVAGLVYFDNMRVQAAARDGARSGAVTLATVAKPFPGCDSALQRLPAGLRPSVGCTQPRTCTASPSPAGSTSEVVLTYNRQVSVPLLGNRSAKLTATSVFECLT